MTPTVVLVVDDDPVILKLLTVNFELEGYEVCTATQGAEALEVAAERRPDVIVSDIMMPVMSGIDLVLNMKVDPALADIPVILLSAKAQAADIRAGLDAGAADYVTKPFAPLDLVARVEAALGR
ncbi:MAG: response regulator with CheY-like receiver domain and winged-helix DNA-binding domain [Acidimicrobiales bacterium]|nr:response regulator with CheY-like receiver domain and winged-helix DNA-binding domain [Acidimicrobiales bacterium]